MKSFTLFFFFFLICLKTWARDPTQGKPFFPWLWQEELKPTFKEAGTQENLLLLTSGIGAGFLIHPYDQKIRKHRSHGGDLLVGKEEAEDISHVTDGYLNVGIALTQLLVDQENGLMHARALLLTSLSHKTSATLLRRKRPDASNRLSYPSGHTSAAFATAGSLAYAYGWEAGIPAYVGATLVGLSRIKDNRHWASDIVAGAALGTYWARASYKAKEKKEGWMTFITPLADGAMVSFSREF